LPLAHALARSAGWLVLALSLGFLGHTLWVSAPWSLAAARGAELAVAIGAGTLAYGLAGFLLAEAWRQLLGPGATTRRRHYHALYGRTQIAKYLPGNCFHFVGRQLLGRRLGHGHGALALASLAETALLLAVAGMLSLPLLGRELGHVLARVPGWTIGAMALAALALILAIVRRGGKRHGPPAARTFSLLRSWAPRVSAAGLLHLAFFAVGGLILWMLGAAAQAPGAEAPGLLCAVSALALGWWVGFVVPGAAAGIGVREAILVLVLEQHLGADGALLAALSLRVVTTSGDLLLFGLCCLAPTHPDNEAVAVRSRS
jgi:glycosyltransferase 2 family protein